MADRGVSAGLLQPDLDVLQAQCIVAHAHVGGRLS